jgi:hypothetical protein
MYKAQASEIPDGICSRINKTAGSTHMLTAKNSYCQEFLIYLFNSNLRSTPSASKNEYQDTPGA